MLFAFLLLNTLLSSALSVEIPLSFPEKSMLDPKAYDAFPAGLTLEQVQVFVRHGERTPVGIRMTNPPASLPEFWNFCHSARQFRAAVLGHNDVVGTQEVLRVVERRDGQSLDGECMLGELTDVGRQSTLKYGSALHEIYVKRLGFLPDMITSNDTATFRSTNMPRTIESLQQVIHGLYPTSKFLNGTVPRIRIRHTQDENLMGNAYVCARLKELMVGFERAAAEKHNPKLALLDDKVSQYIDGHPIRIDGKPRASGVLDTVRAAKSHGIEIPPEFEDSKVTLPIEEAVVAEWFDGYKTTPVRRLAMGRLLAEISERMQNKAAMGEADPLKIAINSCHDTSLAGLCQTLDVFDGRWPQFTASVTFELFSGPPVAPATLVQKILGTQPKSDHYVRMRYQNRNLALPICAGDGKHLPGHPEYCTLSTFIKRAEELTPSNWDEECRPSKKPVV